MSLSSSHKLTLLHTFAPSSSSSSSSASSSSNPSSFAVSSTSPPRIIELLDAKEDVVSPSKCTVSLNEPLFSADPRELIFNSYAPFATTQIKLTLRNKDTVTITRKRIFRRERGEGGCVCKRQRTVHVCVCVFMCLCLCVFVSACLSVCLCVVCAVACIARCNRHF